MSDQPGPCTPCLPRHRARNDEMLCWWCRYNVLLDAMRKELHNSSKYKGQEPQLASSQELPLNRGNIEFSL